MKNAGVLDKYLNHLFDIETRYYRGRELWITVSGTGAWRK